MSLTYRRIALARYVRGFPQPEDFEIVEEKVPKLADGEFLVRNIYASIDPGTRPRLSQGPTYATPLKLGDTAGAFNVGQVLESKNNCYQQGDFVACSFGWSEMGVSNGHGYLDKISNRNVPLSTWIGVLGVPGLTAYFGLKRVAQITEGETVVVTSAAGMVGSTAAQVAKILGCRVVAIAGGPDKCSWLSDELGVDKAIDYKSEKDLGEAVRDACPGGVDILFDNVGNRSVDAILPLMNMRGRIVVSGQVGDYNSADNEVHGIKNTRPFITRRVRMEGLVVFDDMEQFPVAKDMMAAWLEAGRIKYREILYDGIEQAPTAFSNVFEGKGFGRHLLRLAPDPNNQTNMQPPED